jgi:hypothetical protein
MVKEYDEISKINSRNGEEICTKYKSFFGFNTSGTSRAFLYNIVLNDAVNSTGHQIKDRRLISELAGLIIKNGRVDHLPGAHDDSVISWLLSQWFVRYSKNLHFYGINQLSCLSLVADDGATLSDEEFLNKRALAEILKDIENIKQKIGIAVSITETMKYELMLTQKVKAANAYGDTTLNLDSILSAVRKNKQGGNILKQNLAKIKENRFRRQ